MAIFLKEISTMEFSGEKINEQCENGNFAIVNPVI